MALNGTIIDLGKGVYGFEYRDSDYNKPELLRQVWIIDNVKTRGMSYCRNDEAIGKPASSSNGVVSCYLGQGNYVTGLLPGDRKSIILETSPAPRPKCRLELRWQSGGWQKYSKQKGWIAA